LRFIAGSSLSSAVPTLPPTVALVVSTSGDWPVTVTLSSMPPTGSERSIVSVVPTSSTRWLRSMVRNPVSLAGDGVAAGRELGSRVTTFHAADQIARGAGFLVPDDDRGAGRTAPCVSVTSTADLRGALLSCCRCRQNQRGEKKC
jgi:hypothetical protein